MMLARWVSAVFTLMFERGGDFLAAFAFGEQLHDFALAGSEAVAQGFGEFAANRTAGAEIAHDDFGGARREERLVAGQGFDGDDQVAVGIGFDDVAADAGFQNLADQLIGIVNRENQNLGGRARPCEFGGRLRRRSGPAC